MMSSLKRRSLTKVYRDFWGRKKKTALNALDLKIHKGEIFGLLGPNGSGKTTTIKLLLGLLFPTAGDAFVFGEPAAKVEKNERIGYLPEESYLYRFLNAEETLDFYGRLFDIAANTRRQRAAELIDTVGLGADKKRILKEYSKGMRQRIGLAQALINDPELVILDEPTSGLDPLGTAWMKELILDLRDKGKTVLMCSHRLDDVQDVCDRIAILYNGDLQTLGKVSTLVEDAARLEIRGPASARVAGTPGGLEAALPQARRRTRNCRPPVEHAGRAIPARGGRIEERGPGAATKCRRPADRASGGRQPPDSRASSKNQGADAPRSPDRHTSRFSS